MDVSQRRAGRLGGDNHIFGTYSDVFTFKNRDIPRGAEVFLCTFKMQCRDLIRNVSSSAYLSKSGYVIIVLNGIYHPERAAEYYAAVDAIRPGASQRLFRALVHAFR